MRKNLLEKVARKAAQITIIAGFALFVLATSGCHDGPLYALKHINPYFAMREWRNDDSIGVTDHERRNQLVKLTDQIGDMPAKEQAFWAGHLQKMIDNDPSPEMRRLAINAAGKLRTPAAVGLIGQGLKDDNIKVRMEACRALGKRNEPGAIELLAKTAGSESEQDVKNSAIAALGKHKTPIAVDSLRLALSDRDPATQSLAISSLRSVTGKDFGSSPAAWIQSLGPASPSAGSPPAIGSPPVNGSAVQTASANGSTSKF